jgi:hypothetical protein
VRALGEPFDLTTAVQAIDRLHDFLRHLVNRRFPSGVYRQFEEIRKRAAGSVRRRVGCAPASRTC